MKKLFSFMILLLLTPLAQASSMPTISCSNNGGTIDISVYPQNGVVILKDNYPSKETIKLSDEEIEITEQVIQEMPTEQAKCSSRSVVFKQITIAKKDGSSMPDAYNRRAQNNGSLSDYFICTTTSLTSSCFNRNW
jgi:hypothetical protein